MSGSKKVAYIGKDCVACGVCVKHCPRAALAIYKGIYAVADHETCIGCGKCLAACPAGVIQMVAREVRAV
ncbi:MAG: 4Fe-4S dicluster domain-containing protein [Oscillospiraceae bacterium]|jgi:NAD-dependent dihydropyrimidine dehydrogenase PreA subunit